MRQPSDLTQVAHWNNDELEARLGQAASAVSAAVPASSTMHSRWQEQARKLGVESPQNTIQILGLHMDPPCTEAQLVQAFRKHGVVRRVWMPREFPPDSGSSSSGAAAGGVATPPPPGTGVALMEFLGPDAARQACQFSATVNGTFRQAMALVRSAFRGCSFQLSEQLTASQRLRLRFLILDAQGTIINEPRDSPYHFVVDPLLSLSAVASSLCCVTERWVRESHDADRLLPRAGDAEHKFGLPPCADEPLPVAVFAGLTFVVEGSDAADAEHAALSAAHAALTRRLRDHGALVFDVLSDRVTHSVVSSLLPAAEHECFVTPAWVDLAIDSGGHSVNPLIFTPSDDWNKYANPHKDTAAMKAGQVKWAIEWHADSPYTDQPLRDLAADFAAMRNAEKAAAAVAAATSTAAPSESSEDSTALSAPSSTSREVDYHALELSPCSELSLPGMLRLFFHTPEICLALGLPWLSIGILSLIEDYTQYRRALRGTRGFQFMQFWVVQINDADQASAAAKTPPSADNAADQASAATKSPPSALSHFNSRFPFESHTEFCSGVWQGEIFHDLTAAGRFSAAIGPLARDPYAALHARMQRDKSRTLFGRFAEMHTDELRAEDYRFVRASDPCVDEEGQPISDGAAAAAVDQSASIVFPYEATLTRSTQLTGSMRLELLYDAPVNQFQVTLTRPRNEWSHQPASVTVLHLTNDRSSAVAQFEAAFLAHTKCPWELRELIRANEMVIGFQWGHQVDELPLLPQRSAPLAPAASEFAPGIVPPSLPAVAASAVDNNVFRSVFQSLDVPEPEEEENNHNHGGMWAPWANPAAAAAVVKFEEPLAVAPGVGAAEMVSPLNLDAARDFALCVRESLRARPASFATFLQILSDLSASLETHMGAIVRVQSLLVHQPRLLQRFNQFVPDNVRIQFAASDNEDSNDDDDNEEEGEEHRCKVADASAASAASATSASSSTASIEASAARHQCSVCAKMFRAQCFLDRHMSKHASAASAAPAAPVAVAAAGSNEPTAATATSAVGSAEPNALAAPTVVEQPKTQAGNAGEKSVTSEAAPAAASASDASSSFVAPLAAAAVDAPLTGASFASRSSDEPQPEMPQIVLHAQAAASADAQSVVPKSATEVPEAKEQQQRPPSPPFVRATPAQLTALAQLHARANRASKVTAAAAVPVRRECVAQVIAHENRTGHFDNLMSALNCVLPSGVLFKVAVGLTDAQRRTPPRIGSVITVRYQELVSGKPRFPVFVRVRHDLTWAAVMANAESQASTEVDARDEAVAAVAAAAAMLQGNCFIRSAHWGAGVLQLVTTRVRDLARRFAETHGEGEALMVESSLFDGFAEKDSNPVWRWAGGKLTLKIVWEDESTSFIEEGESIVWHQVIMDAVQLVRPAVERTGAAAMPAETAAGSVEAAASSAAASSSDSSASSQSSLGAVTRRRDK